MAPRQRFSCLSIQHLHHSQSRIRRLSLTAKLSLLDIQSVLDTRQKLAQNLLSLIILQPAFHNRFH